jgi:hypothetical protein
VVNNLAHNSACFSTGHSNHYVDTPTAPGSSQKDATTRYLWRLAADRLLLFLTFGLNRHTDRLYRSDLRYLQAWLNEPDLPSTLATLFGNGHDAAKWLLLRHRDHLVDTGHTVGTVNRHLCTIRKAARIAREMGQIDWDLSDVPNIASCDNAQRDKEFSGGHVGAEDQEGHNRAVQPQSRFAPGRDEEKRCY